MSGSYMCTSSEDLPSDATGSLRMNTCIASSEGLYTGADSRLLMAIYEKIREGRVYESYQ